MSIDDQLKGQLADYFGWLEGHLGTTLHAADSARPPRRRPRLAVLVAAVAAAVLVVTASVVARRDDSRTVAPAVLPTTGSDTTSPGAVASTTVSTTVDLGTEGEASWAPLALPSTMEVVDIEPSLVFGLTFADTVTRSQRFVRFAADGVTIEAQLSVEVRPAEDGEIEAWVPNGEVHGRPAIVTTPSLTDSSAWWVEDGLVVTTHSGGFSRNELLALLEAADLRSDPSAGFEPSSVGDSLSVLYDADLTLPRRHTTYVVRDTTRNVYHHIHVGAPSISSLLSGAVRTPAGLLLRTSTVYGWMLVGTDGTVVTFGGIWGDELDDETAAELAAALQQATPAQLDQLGAEVAVRMQTLPVVGTMSVGGSSIELRGGTSGEPVALCLVATEGPVCEFIDVRRDGDPSTDAVRASISIGDQWFLVGYGLASLYTSDGQITVEYAWRFCSANADGSLVQLLPDERSADGGREFFVVAVPADVEFIRLCVDADGELRPNSTGMTARPTQ